MPIGAQGAEILDLYGQLLKHAIERQYGGKEDYNLILSAVDAELPIYGGDITIRKENPRTGQIYTVNYHVKVYDDMGHPISSFEDVGGRCAVDNKIIASGYIFTCDWCGEFFCSKHTKWMKTENDEKVPLCRYGFFGRGGCFHAHEHEYWPIHKDEDRKIKDLQKKAEMLRTEADVQRALKELEDAKRDREAEEPRWLLDGIKEFLPSNVPPLSSPCCNFNPIGGWKVTCPNNKCRKRFRLKASDPMRCPHCGTAITQLECNICKNTFEI
jgi:hypothetical protein